jgi:hypothetical protein
MATRWQIHRLQDALDSFGYDKKSRYDLEWPWIRRDGNYGQLTHKYSKLGQSLLGMSTSEIGQHDIEDVIRWLAHPSTFGIGNTRKYPGRNERHDRRLAAFRAQLAARPRVAEHGLVIFDGRPVMPRVANDLQRMRTHRCSRHPRGWPGTFSDPRYGACRSRADQQYLVDHDRPLGVIVGDVGTSEHECYRFFVKDLAPADLKRGAADITYYDLAREISDELRLGLQNNIAGDLIHMDYVH